MRKSTIIFTALFASLLGLSAIPQCDVSVAMADNEYPDVVEGDPIFNYGLRVIYEKMQYPPSKISVDDSDYYYIYINGEIVRATSSNYDQANGVFYIRNIGRYDPFENRDYFEIDFCGLSDYNSMQYSTSRDNIDTFFKYSDSDKEMFIASGYEFIDFGQEYIPGIATINTNLGCGMHGLGLLGGNILNNVEKDYIGENNGAVMIKLLPEVNVVGASIELGAFRGNFGVGFADHYGENFGLEGGSVGANCVMDQYTWDSEHGSTMDPKNNHLVDDEIGYCPNYYERYMTLNYDFTNTSIPYYLNTSTGSTGWSNGVKQLSFFYCAEGNAEVDSEITVRKVRFYFTTTIDTDFCEESWIALNKDFNPSTDYMFNEAAPLYEGGKLKRSDFTKVAAVAVRKDENYGLEAIKDMTSNGTLTFVQGLIACWTENLQNTAILDEYFQCFATGCYGTFLNRSYTGLTIAMEDTTLKMGKNTIKLTFVACVSFDIPLANDQGQVIYTFAQEDKWVAGTTTIEINIAPRAYSLSKDVGNLGQGTGVLLGYKDGSNFYAYNESSEFTCVSFSDLSNGNYSDNSTNVATNVSNSTKIILFNAQLSILNSSIITYDVNSVEYVVSDSYLSWFIYADNTVKITKAGIAFSYNTVDIDDEEMTASYLHLYGQNSKNIGFCTYSYSGGMESFYYIPSGTAKVASPNHYFSIKILDVIDDDDYGEYVSYALECRYMNNPTYVVADTSTNSLAVISDLDLLEADNTTYKPLAFVQVSNHKQYFSSITQRDYYTPQIYYFGFEYLHLFDYNSDLDYCKDSEHHYYETAKDYYENFFSEYDKLALFTEEEVLYWETGVGYYSEPWVPYERLIKRFKSWMYINGDELDEDDYSIGARSISLSLVPLFSNLVTDKDSSTEMLTIVSVFGIICSASYLIIKGKRKEE